MQIVITSRYHRGPVNKDSAAVDLSTAIADAFFDELRANNGAIENIEGVIRAQARYLGALTQALVDAKVLNLKQVVDFVDDSCLSFTSSFVEVTE